MVDHTFLVKRIFNMDHLYTICSASTRRPFAVCTEDTFEDQFFLYTDKEIMEEKGKELTEKKYATRGVEIPKENNGRRKFFVDAYSMGFTQISFNDESGETLLTLKEIVDVEADMKKLPQKQRPMMNQALQITSLYFVQELNRQIPKEENPAMNDLVDELEHNLAQATFIVAGTESKDPARRGQIGLVNIQDKEGNKYIPIFSDAMEFVAFPNQNKHRGFPTNLKKIVTALNGETTALMLNPASIQLRMPKKLVERINQRAENGEI